MTKVGSSRAKILNCLLAAFGSLTGVLALEGLTFADGDCGSQVNSFYVNQYPPCDSATCQPIDNFPASGTCTNVGANCDDGLPGDFYSATKSTNWYDCHQASCNNCQPTCTRGCTVCANVFYFRGACNGTTIAKCNTQNSAIMGCIATNANPQP